MSELPIAINKFGALRECKYKLFSTNLYNWSSETWLF